MNAKQSFAKMTNELKDRYNDAVTVIEGQAAMIAEANKILEEFRINENDPDWAVMKRLKCSLCDIFDCSTRNSLSPEECLLQSDNNKPTEGKTQ